MTLFYESIYPALFLGVMGIGVLAIAFMQTQRGGFLAGMGVVLLLTLGLLGLERMTVTEVEEVEAVVEKLADDIQANNAPGVLGLISKAKDADGIRGQAQWGLSAFLIHKTKIRDLVITVQPNSDTAKADFVAALHGVVRNGMQEAPPYLGRFVLSFRREKDDGPWLLYNVEQWDEQSQGVSDFSIPR